MQSTVGHLSLCIFLLFAGVCSLCLVGPSVWAGTEDGTILIWDAAQESLINQCKAHADRVSCLECVGSHVWSGSGDRTIVAHDAGNFQMLYSLNDQGNTNICLQCCLCSVSAHLHPNW